MAVPRDFPLFAFPFLSESHFEDKGVLPSTTSSRSLLLSSSSPFDRILAQPHTKMNAFDFNLFNFKPTTTRHSSNTGIANLSVPPLTFSNKSSMYSKFTNGFADPIRCSKRRIPFSNPNKTKSMINYAPGTNHPLKIMNSKMLAR